MPKALEVVIGIIVVPLLLMLFLALLPVLLVLYPFGIASRAWHVARWRMAWPRSRFVLLVYSDSAVWAPYIEEQLLPKIGEHSVVINRSREDWKRRFRVERGMLGQCGLHPRAGPVALVLRGWGRVKVFHFLDAFRQYNHGRPDALERAMEELVQMVQQVGKA